MGLDSPLWGGFRLGGMDTGLTIGEFSRITHLSIKTLRRYHEAGVWRDDTLYTLLRDHSQSLAVVLNWD